MGLQPGERDDIDFGVEERRDDAHRLGVLLPAEDIIVLRGAGVEVDEFDLVFFLQTRVAVVPVSLEGVENTRFADDNWFLVAGAEEFQDGAHGVHVGHGQEVLGDRHVGLYQNILVPDPGEDLVFYLFQGIKDDLLAVPAFDQADPGRRRGLDRHRSGRRRLLPVRAGRTTYGSRRMPCHAAEYADGCGP